MTPSFHKPLDGRSSLVRLVCLTMMAPVLSIYSARADPITIVGPKGTTHVTEPAQRTAVGESFLLFDVVSKGNNKVTNITNVTAVRDPKVKPNDDNDMVFGAQLDTTDLTLPKDLADGHFFSFKINFKYKDAFRTDVDTKIPGTWLVGADVHFKPALGIATMTHAQATVVVDDVAAAPEPSSLVLLCTGLGLAASRFRFRRA